MATRDNTKVIQAHIPTDKKRELDKKLIDDGKTIQQILSEAIDKYLSK